MKSKNRCRVWFWIAMTSFFFSAATFGAEPDIRIGILLNGKGSFEQWSKKNAVTAELAVEEINGAGGIKKMPVKLFVYDTQDDPQKLLEYTNQLIEKDKVLAIVGPLSSGDCEKVFPIANQKSIAAISQCSASPGLTKRFRPYAFRNTIDEVRLGNVVFKTFVQKYNVKKVVIFHDQKTTIGMAFGTKILPAIIQNAGAMIVGTVVFSSPASDLEKEVAKLKGMTFDAVALGGWGPDAVVFAKEFHKQGFKQPVYMPSGAVSPALAALGKDTEGIMACCTFLSSLAPKPFVEGFAKKAQEKNIDPEPLQFDANLYEIITFLKNVIEKTPVTNKPDDLQKDRELIMKGLTVLKSTGLLGPLSFTSDGDANKPVFAIEVKNGKWEIVK